MVSDFYKTFCMNIREKINNSGHNTDTEAVEVSIEEPYIEEYILDFIENLIFEASEGYACAHQCPGGKPNIH